MGAGKVFGGVFAAVLVCGVAYVGLVKKDVPTEWVENQNKAMQTSRFTESYSNIYGLNYKKITIDKKIYTFDDSVQKLDTENSYYMSMSKKGNSENDCVFTITDLSSENKDYLELSALNGKYYSKSTEKGELKSEELSKESFELTVGLSHILLFEFLDDDGYFADSSLIATNLESNQQQLLNITANCKKDNKKVSFEYSLLSKKITRVNTEVENYVLNKLTSKTITKVSIKY